MRHLPPTNPTHRPTAAIQHPPPPQRSVGRSVAAATSSPPLVSTSRSEACRGLCPGPRRRSLACSLRSSSLWERVGQNPAQFFAYFVLSFPSNLGILFLIWSFQMTPARFMKHPSFFDSTYTVIFGGMPITCVNNQNYHFCLKCDNNGKR